MAIRTDMLATLALGLLAAGISAQPGNPDFRRLDRSGRVLGAVVDGGAIFAVEAPGRLWRLEGGAWRLLHESRGVRHLAARSGRLVVLDANGTLTELGGHRPGSLGSRPGAARIALDRRGRLFVLDADGSVWHQETTGFQRIGRPSRTRELAADTGLHALLATGEVYRWDGGTRWSRIPGARDVRQLREDLGLLYALDGRGQVWRGADGIWERLTRSGGYRSLAVRDGNLFLAGAGGEVWRHVGEQWLRVGTLPAAVNLATDGTTLSATTSDRRLLARVNEPRTLAPTLFLRLASLEGGSREVRVEAEQFAGRTVARFTATGR